MEVAYVRALSLAGDEDGAEKACSAALERYPANIKVIEQHVALPSRRGDTAEAARRLDQWNEKFPHHPTLKRLTERMRALDTNDFDVAGEAVDKSDLAQLFTRFESLGASFGGCEFGTVQRTFGAEPIGLLRWGNMQTAGLVRALHDRFEGIGLAENTRMRAGPVGNNKFEYLIHDDRYQYFAHTFIKVDEAPEDRVYQQTLRRLVFLRNKLIEDLEEGDKIFVFKIVDYDKQQVEDLFDAISAYGPNRLLCVASADANRPGGSLDMVRPGLFVGRVNRFGIAAGGSIQGGGTDAAAWRRLCERVTRWQGDGSAMENEAISALERL